MQTPGPNQQQGIPHHLTAFCRAGILIAVTNQAMTNEDIQFNWFITSLAGVLIALALTSCNATRGFGRDLQKVGSEIEMEADKRL